MSSVSPENLRAAGKPIRTADPAHTSYDELLTSSVSPPGQVLDNTNNFSFHVPPAGNADPNFFSTNGLQDSYQNQSGKPPLRASSKSNGHIVASSATGHSIAQKHYYQANGQSYVSTHPADLSSDPNTLSPSPPAVFNHLSPSAAAGYSSDNVPSEISAHTTPSFDEDFLDVDFTILPSLDDGGFQDPDTGQNDLTETTHDSMVPSSDLGTLIGDKAPNLFPANASSYLISPVNTNISSPSMKGEELTHGIASSLFPSTDPVSVPQTTPPNLNRLSLSTMQQTPALTGSSKSSSHDGNARNPAHLTSPIVKVENYSRDDSPSRDMLHRNFSQRSHASQISTSHLHANFGDDTQLDDDDHIDEEEVRLSSRTGYDPNTRIEDEIPSLNEQEEDRQIAGRNADVKLWLATSEIGSDASGANSPRTPATRRKQRTLNRRRAKSVGDPARTGSAGIGYDDSQIPGPGILLNVDSEEDEEDDASSHSSWSDEQEPADIENNDKFEGAGDYFPTVEDEPLPSQFVRVRPWADAPFTKLDSGNDIAQPPTANHAIMIFNRRAGDIDRSSRVATWGTRRLSETDVDKLIQEGGIFKRFSFNNKDRPRKPERKGSGIIANILQRVPSNKRRLSERNTQAGRNRNDSEASLAPPPRTPSFPSSFGRRQTRLNTMGGAVAAMTTSIVAVGASSTVNATTSVPSSSPWERGKQVIKRARSGSNLSISKKTSSEGLTSLFAKHGGPPVPNLASPSIDERANRQLQAPPAQVMDPDDEDDGDDDMADAGVKMELNIRLDPIIPTLEGFLTNVKQLNPRLSPFLADRISHEQLGRYKRLVKLKISHLNAVRSGNCSSTATFCPEFGGQAKILQPRISQRDSDTPFIGFQVNASGPSDDEEQGSFGEGAVAPAQFPQGVPLPPTKRLPAEFECPLCFKVKKFQKPSDWTKHVHEDVQPFTCTWPKCAEPKSFKRKADWVRHENERHRKLEWWTCDIPECSHTCYRKDNFVQHLVREHKMAEPKVKGQKSGGKAAKGRGSKSQNELSEDWSRGGDETTQAEIDKLWELVERCRRDTSKKPQEEPCKFCGNVCSTWKKLTVHLARHMEQISLPVLALVEQRHVSHDTLISPIGQTTQSASLVSPVTPNVATSMKSLSASPYGITANLPQQTTNFIGLHPSASPQTAELPTQFGDVSNQQAYHALPSAQLYANTYSFTTGPQTHSITGYDDSLNTGFNTGAHGSFADTSRDGRFMNVKQEDGYSSGNDRQLYGDHDDNPLQASYQPPVVTTSGNLGNIPVSYHPQPPQPYSGAPPSQNYTYDDGSHPLNVSQMTFAYEPTTRLAYSQAPSNSPNYPSQQYQ